MPLILTVNLPSPHPGMIFKLIDYLDIIKIKL